MATRQFSRADLSESERLLAQLAGENVPDGDFSQGTNLRDLAIRSIASTVMYLRSEVDAVKVLTDIEEIGAIEDDDERASAIETFASNFYLTRGGGGRSRGYVEVTFSVLSSGVIPIGTRFAADAFIFFLDATAPFAYATTTLRQVTNNVTGVTEYVLRVPVLALETGEDYNIEARVFSTWDRFSANILKVENLSTFAGGRAEETYDEFFVRVRESLTVRNLLTRRAINTVLPELFPEIQTLLVVEAGDPEMARDVAPLMTPGFNVHTGGSTDIYGFTDVTENTVDLIIGDPATDAAGVLDTFVDIDFDFRNVDWRGRVQNGDLLRLYNVHADEGNLYTIVEVEAFFVRVQPLIPFKSQKPLTKHDARVYNGVSLDVPTRTFTVFSDESRFTDDDVGDYLYVYDGVKGFQFEIESLGVFVDGYATKVVVLDPDSELATFSTLTDLTLRLFDDIVGYSIGNNYPGFDNKISRRTTGRTTKEMRVPGTVILPNFPIYRVKEVVALDAEFATADAVSGGVVFGKQVSVPPAPGTDEFRVISSRIDHAQSMEAATRVQVGPEDSRSGVDGSFSGVVTYTATFTSTTTTFSASDVGSHILIRGALNEVNYGLYVIDEYISPTSVTLSKAAGAYELDTVVLVNEADMVWSFESRGIYDGLTLRVVYDTLLGFESIASYVDAGEDRVVAASPLFRAPHPIYVGFHLQYQLKSTASDEVDTTTAERFLAAYITSFPAFDVLNITDILQAFRNEYPDVGNVKLPMTADYFLISPNGNRVNFASTDELILSSALAVSSTDVDELALATAHGVSDRTIKHLSFEDLITVQRV